MVFKNKCGNKAAINLPVKFLSAYKKLFICLKNLCNLNASFI